LAHISEEPTGSELESVSPKQQARNAISKSPASALIRSTS
jgi:hypothetical protein